MLEKILNSEASIPIAFCLAVAGFGLILLFGEMWNNGYRTFWIGYLIFQSFSTMISGIILPFIPLALDALDECKEDNGGEDEDEQ